MLQICYTYVKFILLFVKNIYNLYKFVYKI
nr:MAG TPA: hypothetical protein [Caudoviricetes sp.]